MPRTLLRYLMPLTVLLAVFLAFAPAMADDEEGEGEEQTAEGEDGESEEDTTERPDFQNAPAAQQNEDELPEGYVWQREFHPGYLLEHKRDQDVASWTNGFTMTST